MSKLELDIPFGTAVGDSYVMEGWGEPEGGHRWAVGQTSRLRLPITARDEPHVVVLDVVPWTHPPQVTRQRIIVGLNGRYAASLAITHHMAFGLSVPAAMTSGAELLVSIDHLDAPTNVQIDTYRDGRAMNLMVLSVRLFRETPRPWVAPCERKPVVVADDKKQALLRRFESLGHRCAFGLLQMRAGVDQVGLLRFTGIHTPMLIREILNRFEGLATESDLHAFIREDSRGLYSLYDRVRQMWFNTSHSIDDVTPSQVTMLAARRLGFLRRKFLEDLSSGKRIFVVNSPYHLTAAEALALFIVLDTYARNTLLWTNQTGHSLPGVVKRLRPGLYFGQLDVAGQIEGDPSDESWFSICENTRMLMDSQVHGLTTRDTTVPSTRSDSTWRS